LAVPNRPEYCPFINPCQDLDQGMEIKITSIFSNLMMNSGLDKVKNLNRANDHFFYMERLDARFAVCDRQDK
jgi:hypothetical protein